MANVLVLNAGELRSKIEFYNASATRDDAGGYSASTKTLAFTMFAKVEQKKSFSSELGLKVENIEEWNVQMRYENGCYPNESMFAKYDGKYFNIIGIRNVMNRNLVVEFTMIARK